MQKEVNTAIMPLMTLIVAYFGEIMKLEINVVVLPGPLQYPDGFMPFGYCNFWRGRFEPKKQVQTRIAQQSE